MKQFRYWVFEKLVDVAWRVCPEPHRSDLQRGIGTWDEVYERMRHAVPE